MEENGNVTAGSTAGKGWYAIGLHNYIKMAIIAVLTYWLFEIQIFSIVSRWMRDPSWSHGFLIPFFSLYFLNQKKTEILALQPRPNYLGFIGLLICIAAMFYNTFLLRVGYFGYVLLIPTLLSILLFCGGWGLVKFTWLPTVFLFFAIPLPEGLYRQATIPMRILSAKIAAAFLNIVPDMQATANGVVIDVIYRGLRLEPPLDVAEACSGMRLLMAFLALGVAMAYLHYRPIWQRLILLASTVPIAIICNIIRVTVTGFIYVLWDPKYAQGIYHDMLGMAMLPLAFFLYGALAWFMSNLLVEDKQPSQDDIIVRRENQK